MKNCSSRIYLLLLCLSLSVLFCAGSDGFTLCNCPPPQSTTCPAQPTTPPYQPCTLITSANSYVLRFSVNGDRGSMTFIGNTLGLSKAPCLNEPGTSGDIVNSIGAFTTINPAQTVGSYATVSSGDGSPAGTTLDWRENRSSAVLNLPAGVIILHAELIWSGSFGYYCSDPTTGSGIGVDPACVLDFASGPITFITPDGVTHLITADPTTALESQNPAADVQLVYCAGNYTRSQDVTPLLILLGDSNGTYTVGGVPATISALDNDHNAAGWTLAIIYHDPASAFVNNMTLFLGAQQASRASEVMPAAVTGFCAQTDPGLQLARLLVSAIEGDADIGGDQMTFGPTPTGLTPLSGPNNPVDNFFCSQINDDDGQLISTTGTFCTFNSDPNTEMLVPNGRQGYDITNVDCSSTISSGQMEAFALGTTTGDDYMINAIGVEISVQSPTVVPIKQVNGALSINANIGDTPTFTITIENTGTLDALNVVFQDTIESGLTFIPGSLTVNGVPMPGADPEAGVPLGTIAIGDTDIIDFDVMIVSPPPSGNIFVNRGTASFQYSACVELINTANPSNIAVINLPSTDLAPPTAFNGIAKKCQFINKTLYGLTATWLPADLPTVISYEVFTNGELAATIPAEGPYEFDACLHSKKEGNEVTIVAIYPNGFQSVPVNLGITYE